jgi:hypothetical protein
MDLRHKKRIKMAGPQFILICIISILLVNCTATQPPTVHRGLIASGVEQEIITKSLFDAKDRTISEEDIQRLLNGRIKIRDTVRVALFKYASTSINRYYTNW